MFVSGSVDNTDHMHDPDSRHQTFSDLQRIRLIIMVMMIMESTKVSNPTMDT